jgi:hypothetical protein
MMSPPYIWRQCPGCSSLSYFVVIVSLMKVCLCNLHCYSTEGRLPVVLECVKDETSSRVTYLFDIVGSMGLF